MKMINLPRIQKTATLTFETDYDSKYRNGTKET